MVVGTAGSNDRHRSAANAAAPRWLWCVRITVLSAFVLTVVGAGPRAWAVTRARVQALRQSAPRGARVDLDRVGFVGVPGWLRGDLLTAVSLDLASALDGGVGLLDDDGAARLLAELRALPWVRDARLQRVYPDRFRAELEMRAPVARLSAGAGAVALDVDGVCLPCPPRCELPEIDAGSTAKARLGQPHPDLLVRAAAAVAAEWQAEIAAALPGLPALRRVDTTNIGYGSDPTRLCEVRVAVQRGDGGLVWFDYDHPPGSGAPRVPAATKVAVLQRLLAAHPGLVGVVRADLRFGNRWQAWVEYESAHAAPP